MILVRKYSTYTVSPAARPPTDILCIHFVYHKMYTLCDYRIRNNLYGIKIGRFPTGFVPFVYGILGLVEVI